MINPTKVKSFLREQSPALAVVATMIGVLCIMLDKTELATLSFVAAIVVLISWTRERNSRSIRRTWHQFLNLWRGHATPKFKIADDDLVDLARLVTTFAAACLLISAGVNAIRGHFAPLPEIAASLNYASMIDTGDSLMFFWSCFLIEKLIPPNE